MTQTFLKLPFEANEIISPFATIYNIIVNILHFHESINIYNITQDITLDKTTPITGNFFKAAITATTLAIMPIHIFLSTYNIAGYSWKNQGCHGRIRNQLQEYINLSRYLNLIHEQSWQHPRYICW